MCELILPKKFTENTKPAFMKTINTRLQTSIMLFKMIHDRQYKAKL